MKKKVEVLVDEDAPTVSNVEYHIGTREGIGAGYALGMALAVVMSWTSYHAFLWAVLHGLLSWFYVVYFLFTNRGEWTWL
ncbi:MAG: hypothetical protein ACOC2L_05370 [Candidatus Sumerlaeota bacterium]